MQFLSEDGVGEVSWRRCSSNCRSLIIFIFWMKCYTKPACTSVVLFWKWTMLVYKCCLCCLTLQKSVQMPFWLQNKNVRHFEDVSVQWPLSNAHNMRVTTCHLHLFQDELNLWINKQISLSALLKAVENVTEKFAETCSGLMAAIGDCMNKGNRRLYCTCSN